MKEKQGIVSLYKRLGETPKECLVRFRKENPAYANAILSYAGRLDPMAEGLLLVLVDEENKNRAQYLSYMKDYVCEIVWGFATDTHDILGMSEEIAFIFPEDFEARVEAEVNNLHGHMDQPFPAYSSKPVSGKPLFQWAREGRIDEIEIPLKNIHIEDAHVVSHNAVQGAMLLSSIEEKILKVSGDFRQAEIISRWKEALASKEKETIKSTTAFFSVSGGTYIRGLAHLLGQNLGCGGVVLSLSRTRVGEYSVDNALP